MKIFLAAFCLFLLFNSCQKNLSFETPGNTVDSLNRSGQLVGIKSYNISVDTIPYLYSQFSYDSVALTMTENCYPGNYNTMQFNFNYPQFVRIWKYNNDARLLQQSVKGIFDGNKHSYENTFNRDASGNLVSFEHFNMYNPVCFAPIIQEKVTAQFKTQIVNGVRSIRFTDTTGGIDIFGNLHADYTVYFDASNRPVTKVMNGIVIPDPNDCNRTIYKVMKDTLKQFFYDPLSGRLQKYVDTYIELNGTFPGIRKYINSVEFLYDSRDNGKLGAFFSTFTWGRDLQFWLSYRLQSIYGMSMGTDYDYFSENFLHLKYGACQKIKTTYEQIIDGVSKQKWNYEQVYKNDYDSAGNLIRCSIPAGSESVYEFVYKR